MICRSRAFESYALSRAAAFAALVTLLESLPQGAFVEQRRVGAGDRVRTGDI